MKKITSILLVGAALASCGAPGNEGYEINGSYVDSTMDSSKVFLMNGEEVLDSAVLADKAFAFKGAVDSIAAYRLAFKHEKGGQVRYSTLSEVFLEQGTKLNVAIDKGVKMTDNGGVNEIYSNFMENAQKLQQEQMAKYQELMAAQVERDSVVKVMNEMTEAALKTWKEAISNNGENIVGAAIFSEFCPSIREKAEFDSICATLKYTELFASIVKQKEHFERVEATSEGKMFTDFGGKDMDGKEVKLSDFVGKGKYVLVDFWASWCGPCRGEIPNILAVNKKYSGEKFMVLGVDVWDQEDKFKEAVEAEKINYAQMFTEGKEATSLYGINGIPQIMLFAPDGTIVKRGLRGQAIEAAVAENLKK